MRSPRSGRRSLQAGDARTSAAGRSYPVQTLPSYPEQVFRTSAPRDSVNTSRSPETLRPVRETHRLPGWTIALLIVCVVLALGLFTAKTVMNGYLRQQEEARQAAHTALLDAHPYHYETLIRQYAGIYNLHSAYVAAIILNESAFDPRAVSSAGAEARLKACRFNPSCLRPLRLCRCLSIPASVILAECLVKALLSLSALDRPMRIPSKDLMKAYHVQESAVQ